MNHSVSLVHATPDGDDLIEKNFPLVSEVLNEKR